MKLTGMLLKIIISIKPNLVTSNGENRIKQDSSLRTNPTWQVDTNMVLLQAKYIQLKL